MQQLDLGKQRVSMPKATDLTCCQVSMPKATDLTFTEKVYMRHKNSSRLKAPKMSKGVGLSKREGFVVRHFAGDVL